MMNGLHFAFAHPGWWRKFCSTVWTLQICIAQNWKKT